MTERCKGVRGALVVAPIERVVDHDRFRHSPRIVAQIARQVFRLAADDIARHFVRPIDPAGDRLGIGIDEQLRVVETQPALRIIRTENPEAVKLPGPHVRQEDVPDLVGVLGHRDADIFLACFGAIEETEIDRGRCLGEKRKIHPVAEPGGAERIRIAEPDFDGSHERADVFILSEGTHASVAVAAGGNNEIRVTNLKPMTNDATGSGLPLGHSSSGH